MGMSSVSLSFCAPNPQLALQFPAQAPNVFPYPFISPLPGCFLGCPFQGKGMKTDLEQPSGLQISWTLSFRASGETWLLEPGLSAGASHTLSLSGQVPFQGKLCSTANTWKMVAVCPAEAPSRPPSRTPSHCPP